ncbi:MAG: hypothetical protein GY940_43010 [bacterium]|nr:hypothetical protein [bacterium]
MTTCQRANVARGFVYKQHQPVLNTCLIEPPPEPPPVPFSSIRYPFSPQNPVSKQIRSIIGLKITVTKSFQPTLLQGVFGKFKAVQPEVTGGKVKPSRRFV